MIVNNRKSLAQNFFAKSHVVASLVKESSISSYDIVYEIGPGTGILTKELIQRAKKVIAIEKDCDLYIKLKKKFEHNTNIVLHNADFLNFTIKESRYKVFANIPFNITSAIVRKIIHPANSPTEAYLVLQKEAAEKFVGTVTTSQFSVLVKPWFKLKIIRCFKRTDFSPASRVDVVMLHIEKRIPSLISPGDMQVYERFIRYGFGAWKRNLKLVYKSIFTHNQWKRLSHDLGFSIRAKPSELSFRQWLGLFEFFKERYKY